MESQQEQWQIDASHAIGSKFKKFAKNHDRENDSLFANLQRILDILNTGHKLGSFQVGYFRSESDGVYRIGQTGVASARESRLYVLPVVETKTVYVLGIGDKDTQAGDINEAKELAEVIKAGNR
jgi:hypothetical protein